MTQMLFIIACALLTVKAVTEEEYVSISKACKESTEVDPDVIQKYSEDIFSDDEKFKDYLLCVANKVGYVNADGKVQIDNLKKSMLIEVKDERLVDTIIKKCVVPRDTIRNTIYETSKCYLESKPKLVQY